MSDLNPLTLGDTPEELTENEDGSVTFSEETLDEPVDNTSEFFINLAETLDKSILDKIGTDLVELIDKDKQARQKRDKQYEEGIRRTGLGDDAPGGAQFAGASKVVHPVMAEACVDFASSAIKELFPPSGPVKTEQVGTVSREQVERGERKKELMNWQLTKQMPEYYDELEQLLSQLPLGGAQYLKIRPDEALRRPVAEFVPIDEILLPYASTSFYTAQRMTHRQMITQTTYEERVASGLYRDIEDLSTVGSQTPELSAAAAATEKVEGVEESAYNEDGLREIFETYVWSKVEEDGITSGKSAPYIIHIDKFSEKVLGMYRNWDEEDKTSFEKLDWIVEWKFIPWRGAYGIGLPHLIGGLSAALTGALRALLDSAHINNAPSMLKLKGARGSVGANKQVQITEVTEVDVPPNVNDIRQIAMPMPFNPPSTVLFQLLGWLTDAAKGVVSTAEEKISEAGNNMPVGTAMALIEQGSKVFSAIHGRLHRSQAKTLEILHRINSKWLDEEQQMEKLGKVIATREDFTGSMDVIPASDPNIFSETQRYGQIQAVLQMAQDPTVPWNKPNIYKRMLHLMHVPQPEELLPIPPDPVTADPLTEMDTALRGNPIKADVNQDHLAHLHAHMTILSAPWVIANPLIPPPVIQAVLAHANEHILMLQSETVASAARALLSQARAEGTPATGEQLLIPAIAQAQSMLQQKLAPIAQQMGQIQQQLQARTPPAPMPPEVQASIQIAKMDIDRKSQMDQATLQAKQSEQQAKQAMEQATLQMDQAKMAFDQRMEAMAQQFNQYIEQQKVAQESQLEQLRQQIELMNNASDNRQQQMTELLKNRDDNETNVLIERIRGEMSTLQSQMGHQKDIQVTKINLAPQLQQMEQILGQLGDQETSAALASVMESLRAAVEPQNSTQG